MNWYRTWKHRLRHLFRRLYRTVMNVLGWIQYVIATVARTTWSMLRAWWGFRPMRDLVLGLPAILALLGTIGLVAAAHVTQASALRDRYRDVALHAFAAGEWERALVALERVCELDPGFDQARYELALACEKTGNLPRCEALMQQLAPRDRQGYAPAHLWIAGKMLKTGRLAQPEFDIARAHLARARQDISQVATVDQTMADLLIAMGRTDEAREVLRRLPSASGEQLLGLARDSAAKGKPEDAKREALAAMDRFAAQVLEKPDDTDARIRLAESCAMAGQTEKAENVLRDGVAMNPQGPCTLALVRFYVTWVQELSKSPDAASRAKAVSLLNRARSVAETLPPDNVTGLSLLADISLALNEPAKAAEYLRRAAPKDLASSSRLAELLTVGGRKDEAHAQAQKVLDEAARQLKENARNPIARLSAARSAAILGDYPRATSLLEEGFRQTKDPRYAALLGRMYVAWYDDTRKSDPQSPPRVDLLRKTFEVNPWDAAVLQRMLAVMKDKTPAADEARKFVKDRLAAGNVPAVAHLLVGSDALESGDAETARKHLELAFQLEPKMVAIANNLAWTLSQTEPRDLPRALDLVASALTRAPDSVECLDTRGHIYYAMERWEEAVRDLERVLKTRPNDAKLHRTLAEAYHKLKMDDLAKRHYDASIAPEGKVEK